ncbi:Kinesin-like protein KIF28P [Armadillidium vulgare]|nr:Kinesin-like protein KIF28P [Armadillidium vulgare]
MISPQMMGKTEGKTEFNVKLRNLENGTEYLWAKHKFMDRLYKMREMYNNYEEEAYGDDWDDDENDPFYESIDTEVHIGNVQFIIQPLAHMVEVVPCNKSGKEYSEKDDVFVDNPDDLIGRDLYFKIKIMGARGLPNRYSEVYCTYKFYLDEEEHKTKPVTDTTNPNFKYEKKFTYKPVTKQFIDYLMKESLVIKVKGKQRVRRSAIPASLQGLSTRDMLKNDRTVFSKNCYSNERIQHEWTCG